MTVADSILYIQDINTLLDEYDFTGLYGKTVFVTGATGLICSALIDVLLLLNERGADITVIGAGRNASRINERFDGKVTALEYDASATNDFPESVDYVFCGAGNASPELFVNEPAETMLSNITGVTNLLNYCRKHKARMIYISSSEVYGRKESESQFSETDYGYLDLDNIRNSYAEAKRASEMLCRSYAAEYGVDVSIIRPGHVYGPTASTKDRRISSAFAYKAALGENLEMLSSGCQRRSYCYCLDAACALLVCALRGKSGEAYNIGTESVISIRQMAEYISEAGQVALTAKEPTEEEKSAFNPMNNSSLCKDKLYELGYKQFFDGETGFEHTVLILRECLEQQK